MAVTLRSRRTAYDNIAAGSATGPERTVAGDSTSPIQVYGGGTMTSTSNGEAFHSNVKAGTSTSETNGIENILVGQVPVDEFVARVT